MTKKQFVDKKQRDKWKKEKGMIVFSFCESRPPFKVIDMFVEEPFPFKEIYRNRVIAKIDNIEIPLISIEHLQKLKLDAARPQDLIDFVQLRAIKEKI